MPVWPRRLAGSGIRADARDDRLLFLPPPANFGILFAELALPLREPRLVLGNLGFPMAQLGHLLGQRISRLGQLGQLGNPLLQLHTRVAQLDAPIAQSALLLQVSDQLSLNQVDEEVDFLLVITTLADTRPGERDIVDISRSENHSSSPGASDVTGTVEVHSACGLG